MKAISLFLVMTFIACSSKPQKIPSFQSVLEHKKEEFYGCYISSSTWRSKKSLKFFTTFLLRKDGSTADHEVNLIHKDEPLRACLLAEVKKFEYEVPLKGTYITPEGQRKEVPSDQDVATRLDFQLDYKDREY